jgi:hypothetical protein
LLSHKDSSQGGLNAGIILFQPSIFHANSIRLTLVYKTDYENMLKLLNNGEQWSNSDQGIIERYFEKKGKLHLFNKEEVTFARCCFADWFDRKKLRIAHYTHFALDFQELANVLYASTID